MARIRTIKPEFWQSEKVGRLSVGARLTFILLISLADDEGRGRSGGRVDPRFLISTGYPYDSHNTKRRVPLWLKEIEDQGLAVFYDGPDKCGYYWVVGFSDNQYIEKPSKSKFPPPPPNSGNTPRKLPEDSPLEGIRDQGRDQGEEGARGFGATNSKTPTEPKPPKKAPKEAPF